MAAEKKARAEAEARAEEERRLREEAERTALEELAVKVAAERKARAQAEHQMLLAKQAREKAEQQLSLSAVGDPEALRAAHEKADAAARAAEKAMALSNAIAEAAAREKAQAEARIHAERAARADAEDRAKAEAVQRIMQEREAQSRAQAEITERVARELKAREDAERAEEAQYRADAEARAAQSAAQRRLQLEALESARRNAAVVRPGRKKLSLASLAIAALALIGIALAVLHLYPMSSYIPGVQALMEKRLGEPVSIGNMRYAVFPAPQLTLQRVDIGKTRPIKIDEITVPIWPIALLRGTRELDLIEARGVSLDAEALAQVAKWTRANAQQSQLHVERVKLNAVRVAAPGMKAPPTDIDARFGRGGELTRASVSLQQARAEVTPKDQAWHIEISAGGWKPFIGPAVQFDELEATAMVQGEQATVTAIKGRAGGGEFSGQLKASWSGGGTIRVSGNIKLENGKLQLLLPFFTRDFSASGTVGLSANYALASASVATLFDAARVDGAFTVNGGELQNVDIVRAMQANRAQGHRGGKTRFD
ncbi:MAG: hypothetical protein FJY56_13310 [Betaproteobacteria bacterium]|nr:hypothetical protein [Betaproteobacteria bacterium]